MLLLAKEAMRRILPVHLTSEQLVRLVADRREFARRVQCAVSPKQCSEINVAILCVNSCFVFFFLFIYILFQNGFSTPGPTVSIRI